MLYINSIDYYVDCNNAYDEQFYWLFKHCSYALALIVSNMFNLS